MGCKCANARGQLLRRRVSTSCHDRTAKALQDAMSEDLEAHTNGAHSMSDVTLSQMQAFASAWRVLHRVLTVLGL
eukprot:1834769-Alexandrium_andersonii.AAC.1